MPDIPSNKEAQNTDAGKPVLDWAALSEEVRRGLDPFSEFDATGYGRVEPMPGRMAGTDAKASRDATPFSQFDLAGFGNVPARLEPPLLGDFIGEPIRATMHDQSDGHREMLHPSILRYRDANGMASAAEKFGSSPLEFDADLLRNAALRNAGHGYIDGSREVWHPISYPSDVLRRAENPPVRSAQMEEAFKSNEHENGVEAKASTRSKRDNALAQLGEFAAELNTQNASFKRDELKGEFKYKLTPEQGNDRTLGIMEFRGGISLDKKLQAAGAEAVAGGKDVVVVHGKHKLYVTPQTDLVEKFKEVRGFDDRQALRRDLSLRLNETPEGTRLDYEGKNLKRAVKVAIEETRAMHKTLALTANGIDLGEISGSSQYQDLKAQYDQARKALKVQALPKESGDSQAKRETAESIESEAKKDAEVAQKAGSKVAADEPTQAAAQVAPAASESAPKVEASAPARRIDFDADNMTIERYSHPSGFSLVRDRAGQTDAQSLMKPQYRILSDKGEAIGTFTGRLSMNGQEKLLAFPSRSMLADDLRKFEAVAEQMGLRKTEPDKSISAFAESDVARAGERPQSQARRELIEPNESEFAPGYEKRLSFFYPPAEDSVSESARTNREADKRKSDLVEGKEKPVTEVHLLGGVGAGHLSNPDFAEDRAARQRAQEQFEQAMKGASKITTEELPGRTVNEPTKVVGGGKAASIAGGAAAIVTVLTEGAEAAGLLK
ncbi:MAG TPA: hypothetical protein PKZ32_00825 [Candidatus Melainabacteria bacterium]|jgi:hypothetical protein|nr:hypothetical protein [Candidatus Melainabacteria bacterium]